ncbi:MerC domain-containing protein [Glaciecola sp. SC05]|uniref:MerC domain-containing protein n=1 Tax=Glaciecola sp. SC05 TaxID=1987355 RepID=UPI0035276ACD
MTKFISASDNTAIAISFMCILHCLALPVLLTALPSVTALLALSDERFHLFLVFAVIPISIFAMLFGYFYHRQISVLLVGLIGLLTLASAALLGHDILGHSSEVVLTVVGSVLIAFSHLQNLLLRRSEPCNKP